MYNAMDADRPCKCRSFANAVDTKADQPGDEAKRLQDDVHRAFAVRGLQPLALAGMLAVTAILWEMGIGPRYTCKLRSIHKRSPLSPAGGEG